MREGVLNYVNSEGITRREAARRLCINEAQLSRWINGVLVPNKTTKAYIKLKLQSLRNSEEKKLDNRQPPEL